MRSRLDWHFPRPTLPVSFEQRFALVWFVAPIAMGVMLSLSLDLMAWLADRDTFSEAMEAAGLACGWVKVAFVAGWLSLGGFLFHHFWG